MKRTKTELKTKITPKIAVGVLLIAVGLAFGAVGFNALVPTFLNPTNDTVSIAQSTTGWIFVYGPGRNTEKNWTDLREAVKKGYDIKLVVKDDIGNFKVSNCIDNYVSYQPVASVACFGNQYRATETLKARDLAYSEYGTRPHQAVENVSNKSEFSWYVKN